MSEIADDLLHEVEQLEASTRDLEESTARMNQQVDQAKKAGATASTEANLLALEAAKTAQEASIQSQKAAQTSIKQAENLKAQALELNESNFNWRQAVRNAAKDFQSARSSFGIMLTVSILFSVSAAGAVGYLFYAMQKQEAQFKGEVLDIITTENTLLNKKITLKIDELASVVETLSFEVSKLNTADIPAKSMDIIKDAKAKADNMPMEKPMAMAASAQPTEKPEEAALHSNKTDTAVAMNPIKSEAKMTDEKSASVDMADKMTDKPAMAVATLDTKAIAAAVKPIVEQAIKEHSHHASANVVSKQEVSDLKTLVEKVISQQDALQSQLNKQAKMIAMVKKPDAKTTTASVAPAMISGGLTEKQVKKLNDISWLIRKQGKTLKAIQTRLGTDEKAKPVETTVIAELHSLKQQQSMLQQQLLNMQKGMQVLINQAKTPEPYKYQAK